MSPPRRRPAAEPSPLALGELSLQQLLLAVEAQLPPGDADQEVHVRGDVWAEIQRLARGAA